jgi:hypothetical protein
VLLARFAATDILRLPAAHMPIAIDYDGALRELPSRCMGILVTFSYLTNCLENLQCVTSQYLP